MRLREYAGPLVVLAAGVIGFSLLCSVSALAMSDLNNSSSTTLEPLNLVDMAVDNLGTAAAFTEQAITAFVPTPTVGPTDIATASLIPTSLPSDTATVVPSFTPRQPTRTRRPRPTATARPLPTRTRTPLPTYTNTPRPTDTPPPTATLHPTDTPLPPPTDTPVPPPTDTSIPPPTNPPVIELPLQVLDATPTLSP